MSRLAFGGLVVAWVLTALSAQAQAPAAPEATVPDVPSGTGRIVGQVIHPDGSAELGELPIGLYSLAADGSPSMRNTTTDSEGRFAFDDISNSSGVVYLVGTRYRDISYGKRVRFDPGQAELRIDLEVSEPSSDPGDIAIGETTIELGWHGGQLAVQERTQLSNTGNQVFRVPEENRQPEQAPLRARIPEDAHSLRPALGILSEHFELDGGDLRYWGAIYPDGGEVAYGYLVPPQPGAGDGNPTLEFRRGFPAGSGPLSVLVPVDTPELSSEGLAPGPETEVNGRRFRTLTSDPLEPGSEIALALEAPEADFAATPVEISQVNAWFELDDTVMEINMEYVFSVDGPGLIAGTPDNPLLHLGMPEDAEFRGVSSTVDQLGVEQSEMGGINVVGPLPAGESRLSLRYRLPAQSGNTHFDLAFPFPVPLLNVLVADTGIVIENDRLHRRRPTRSGTRLYLHREAFQIEPDETLKLKFQPLERQPISSLALLFPFFLAASFGAWFMTAPLRSSEKRSSGNLGTTSTRAEREGIYDAIRDLDHDFETGKLSEEDHARMSSELRSQAMVWMRKEQSEAESVDHPPSDPASPAHCPQCENTIDENWTFCPGCGAALEQSPDHNRDPAS